MNREVVGVEAISFSWAVTAAPFICAGHRGHEFAPEFNR